MRDTRDTYLRAAERSYRTPNGATLANIGLISASLAADVAMTPVKPALATAMLLKMAFHVVAIGNAEVHHPQDERVANGEALAVVRALAQTFAMLLPGGVALLVTSALVDVDRFLTQGSEPPTPDAVPAGLAVS